MRKLFLILTGSVFCVALASAQIFVGGSIGLSNSGGSVKEDNVTTDKTRTTDFEFSPMAGYFISEDIAVGARLFYSRERIRSIINIGPNDVEQIKSEFLLGFTPFARYYAVRMNKFSIYGQAQMGFAFGSSKTKSEGTTTDGPRISQFQLGFFPGLSYDLNDRVSLETNINLLNFGVYRYTTKEDDTNGEEIKDVTTGFMFGAGTDGIVNTGSITIGAIINL